MCTCPFPPSANVKEVSSDARAFGISAEMNNRRCWAAELESGSGKEPREPTKLERAAETERKEERSLIKGHLYKSEHQYRPKASTRV